jgi:hypothetical protein
MAEPTQLELRIVTLDEAPVLEARDEQLPEILLVGPILGVWVRRAKTTGFDLGGVIVRVDSAVDVVQVPRQDVEEVFKDGVQLDVLVIGGENRALRDMR